MALPSARQTPWTERVSIVPLSDTPPNSSSSLVLSPLSKTSNTGKIGNKNGTQEFNIMSFNILAESYLTPRSHPGLPSSFAAVAFTPTRRRKLLLDTLQKFCHIDDKTNAYDESREMNYKSDTISGALTAQNECTNENANNSKMDILCLQELDLIESVLPELESWGYQVVHTPSSKKERIDCCAIAFDRTKFRLVGYEVVKFDDLASLIGDDNVRGKEGVGDKANENPLCASDCDDKKNTKKGGNREDGQRSGRTKKTQTVPPSELTGIVRSFLRRNCAVIAHLETMEAIPPIDNSVEKKSHQLIVASAHLYWHPGYEYVKLCQAKYLLERVHSMAARNNIDSSNKTPVIICGDMNSKPGSIVHQLFVTRAVDARKAAPWHYFYDSEKEIMYHEEEVDTNFARDNRIGDIQNQSLDSTVKSDRADGQDQIITHDDNVSQEKEQSDTNASQTGLSSNGEFKLLNQLGSADLEGLPEDFNLYCGTVKAESGIPPSSSNGSQSPEHESQPTADVASEINQEFSSDNDELEATLVARRLNKHVSPQDYQHSTPPQPVKYMLDFTLNRFTRWLRILGIDAALETEEEERQRTQEGNIGIFDRCKNERRTLITTSYKLLLRKDCPPGAYLLNTKATSHLEDAFVRLLCTHGVELIPRVFLTRCVVCNGHIHRVKTNDEKNDVFVEHGAPGLIDSKEVMEVFRCDGCRQGYWWDDRPSSSASRVFVQATKLFRLCLRGGVKIKGEGKDNSEAQNELMGAFDFVDVMKERRGQNDDSSARSSSDELAVITWLREENLSNPFQLRSAYSLLNTSSESLHFTNVTLEFVGLLDYIFYDYTGLKQVGKLNIPISFRDMNPDGISRGHLLPSDIWPSDHLAVGARFQMIAREIQTKTSGPDNMEAAENGDTEVSMKKSEIDSRIAKPSHPPRCACGCVPQILSLFEMAELRKKAREAKKLSK